MMLELPPIKGAYIRNDVPGVYSTLGLTSILLNQYISLYTSVKKITIKITWTSEV